MEQVRELEKVLAPVMEREWNWDGVLADESVVMFGFAPHSQQA